MAENAASGLLKDGFLLFNPSLFQVKLTTTNYPQWRDDISDLLFGLELSHFVHGTQDKL